jgi:hypothetical protein
MTGASGASRQRRSTNSRGRLTRRTRRVSLQLVIKELKPYIMGWRGYFGFCQTPRVLTNLEAWIRRRLRLYLWRQWRTGQNRFAELRRRGVAKFAAALQRLIKELKPYIVGWRGYFGFCQTPRVLTNLEAWIRRKLRLYLWRQWRTRQNRFAELRRRGVAKFPAAVAAGSPTGLWRMSGHPAVQQALRNAYFESLGLPQICAPAQA